MSNRPRVREEKADSVGFLQATTVLENSKKQETKFCQSRGFLQTSRAEIEEEEEQKAKSAKFADLSKKQSGERSRSKQEAASKQHLVYRRNRRRRRRRVPMLNGNLQPVAALGNGATGIVLLAKAVDSKQTRCADESPALCLAADHHHVECNGGGSTEITDYFALKAFRRSREHDLLRSQNEEQVLTRVTPHPFLPRFHGAFDLADFRFLVLDFCAGGDLSSLRRCIPERHFSTSAIRFYAAEIVLALHHLHLHGVVYRDLKPENILLSAGGHIVLTDFDLSAILPPKKHSPSPSLHSLPDLSKSFSYEASASPRSSSSADLSTSNCWSPLLFLPSFLSRRHHHLQRSSAHRVMPAPPSPDLEVEAVDLRYSSTEKSHSFVGTEEYVAPEIIQGSGHEFAVDWWGLGVVLYEMAYGKTPFRGATREETFYNIAHGEVSFPRSCNTVSKEEQHLRDLIWKLLMKQPHRRLGYFTGSDEFKAHPFFAGLHWDGLSHVLRPPFVPYTPPSYDASPRFDLMAHLLKVEVARSEARAKKIVRATRRHLPQPS